MSAQESPTAVYALTDFVAYDLSYWSDLLTMSIDQRRRVREDVEFIHNLLLFCLCAAMDKQLYRLLDERPELLSIVELIDGTESEVAVNGVNATIRLKRQRGSIIVGHVVIDPRH